MPLSERKNMVKNDLKGLSVPKPCNLLMLHLDVAILQGVSLRH
jgi:hypothetical protein